MSLSELSDYDIKQYFKSNRLFGGVYTNYNMPRQIQEKFYILLMLKDKSSTNGHWVLCYNIGPKAIFVDSFGVAPCVAFKNFMKSSGKPCYYSNIDFQNIRSEDCGEYCVHIANELLKHKTMRQITKEFSSNTLKNDKILANYAKTEHISSKGDGKEGGNIITDKLRDVWTFIRGNRLGFDTTGRKILEKYGMNYIVQIQVKRTPLSKALTTIGNLISLGKMKQVQKKYNYDDLYHLYSVLYLDNGVKIQYEKTQVPKLSIYKDEPHKLDLTQQINFQPKHKLRLIETINRHIQYLTPQKYFSYKLNSFNCQNMIDTYLTSNDLNEPSYKKFILQNADELVRTLPRGLSKGIDTLLNLATRGDVLLNGQGLY